MKTTIASGSSSRVWRTEIEPQSPTCALEMPVPTCGSRTTSIPSPSSRRATSASSGIDSESPVTSTVSSSRGSGGSSPIARGSK